MDQPVLQTLIAIVIFANAVFLGLEVDYGTHHPRFFLVAENIFTLNMERQSSAAYFAAAIWFAERELTGFAEYLRNEGKQEQSMQQNSLTT
jgi:hypothetical protein